MLETMHCFLHVHDFNVRRLYSNIGELFSFSLTDDIIILVMSFYFTTGRNNRLPYYTLVSKEMYKSVCFKILSFLTNQKYFATIYQ